MSILLRETAGDTLAGAVDSVNKSFTTSFDFDSAFVNVYQNGLLIQADLETGYNLIPPRTIVMKEAPVLDGDGSDTIEIEYRGNVKTGGGALGGTPQAPQATVVEPNIATGQNIPDIVAQDLVPAVITDTEEPSLVTLEPLKPTMLGNGDL